MTLLLKQIFGFLKLLNSDTGTVQISMGIAAGFILGMIPALSLQSLLVFLLIFFFRIQIGAALLTSFFFAFPAFLLDGVFHDVGAMILSNPGLKGFFTTLYNMPIIPYTRFNNSIVMGASVVAFALSPIIFFVAKKLIVKYREKIVVERKAWDESEG